MTERQRRRQGEDGAAQCRQGNLPAREAATLQRWEEIDLYGRLQARGEKCPRFILHDGPPFSQGSIHVGHMLNKLLKDFIIKFRAMQGYRTPFVPGWDTHALAIEIQAIQSLPLDRTTIPALLLRRRCAALARLHCTVQRKQFRRLGILGDWRYPYLTLYPEYEAAVLGAFRALVANGLVYRALKPVHWCATCVTALAETEIAEDEHRVQSAHVAFPVHVRPQELCPHIPSELMAVVIVLERPWMLPGVVALAVHPEATYVLVSDAQDAEGFVYLVAQGQMEEFICAAEMKAPQIIAHVTGAALQTMQLRHPLTQQRLPILAENEAPAARGTGIHPVAPDHQAEDFALAARHGLGPVQPIDATGFFV